MPGLNIEAFVLAGGKSSRMGRDKGLVLLKKRPMVSYVLQKLKMAGLPVKIIAHDPAYHSFDLTVLSDVVKEKGPMGGLLTALENSEAEVVLLVSCDMPLIPVEAIKALISLAEKEKIVAVDENGRVNPLFALYPVHLKQKLKESIEAGELKMTNFILENKHTLVPSIAREMPGCFHNINSEKELKMIEEKWNSSL